MGIASTGRSCWAASCMLADLRIPTSLRSIAERRGSASLNVPARAISGFTRKYENLTNHSCGKWAHDCGMWVTGHRQPAYLQTVGKLADALGITRKQPVEEDPERHT